MVKKDFCYLELKWVEYPINFCFEVPITLTNFSALFIRGSSLRFIVLFLETFDWKFTFLLALKDGKSGHTLKGSKNYTIYLEWLRRINIVE